MFPGVVHRFQHLVVQQNGTALVVTGGEKLDELPPVSLVFVNKETGAIPVQHDDKSFEYGLRKLGQMLVAKILQSKLLDVNLVHRRAAISNRTDLVSIKLLPPVQRCCDVQRHCDEAKELAVIGTGVCERLHKFKVGFSNTMTATIARVCVLVASRRCTTQIAVALLPTIHWVSHPANGSLPAVGFDVFNFYHS